MKISSAANTLAISFLIFIVVYLWIGYYIRGFALPLMISVMVTVAANYAISFITKKRYKTQMSAKKRAEHMQSIILQLKFMTRAQTLALFKAALSANEASTADYKCITDTKKITVTKNGKETEVYPYFHKSPTEADIIECLKAVQNRKGEKQCKLIIAAESFSPALIIFVRAMKANITLLDGKAVYNQILAPADTFPKILVEIKRNIKLTLRDVGSLMFSRERTKGYVITALIILFTSFIIRFNLYYIILATIVFGLALSSHFAPMHKQESLFD